MPPPRTRGPGMHPCRNATGVSPRAIRKIAALGPARRLRNGTTASRPRPAFLIRRATRKLWPAQRGMNAMRLARGKAPLLFLFVRLRHNPQSALPSARNRHPRFPSVRPSKNTFATLVICQRSTRTNLIFQFATERQRQFHVRHQMETAGEKIAFFGPGLPAHPSR